MRRTILSPDLIIEMSTPIPLAGCWLWLGAWCGQGYGVLRVEGSQVKAHRASFECFVGPIQDGLFVCHRCDTPACVNPAHLYAGTPKQNTGDAKARNRICHGERCHSSALTREQVVEIYESAMPWTELAENYGMGITAIDKIKRGKSWGRVTAGLRKGGRADRSGLTDSIRREIAMSSGSQKEIARRYGISQSHVCRIKARELA